VTGNDDIYGKTFNISMAESKFNGFVSKCNILHRLLWQIESDEPTNCQVFNAD